MHSVGGWAVQLLDSCSIAFNYKEPTTFFFFLNGTFSSVYHPVPIDTEWAGSYFHDPSKLTEVTGESSLEFIDNASLVESSQPISRDPQSDPSMAQQWSKSETSDSDKKGLSDTFLQVSPSLPTWVLKSLRRTMKTQDNLISSTPSRDFKNCLYNLNYITMLYNHIGSWTSLEYEGVQPFFRSFVPGLLCVMLGPTIV